MPTSRVTYLILDGLQNQMQLLELQQEFLNNLYVFRSFKAVGLVSAFSASLSGGSSPAKSFPINTYNWKKKNSQFTDTHCLQITMRFMQKKIMQYALQLSRSTQCSNGQKIQSI